MLRVVTTGRFDKEYLLMHRRGKDLAKLEKVMLMLAEESRCLFTNETIR